MASVTGGGESRLGMIGIRSVVVVRHVARVASAGGQMVVAVDVALRARESGVLSSERKARAGVIELPTSPRVRVVTILTGRRYVGLLVIRIGGSLIILQMAGYARGVGEAVVAVDVTL